ncbi:DUF1456 family protein [Pseudomonadota bacterium]
MTNNDVLRRIRYTFNFDDSKMIAIFALAGLEVTRAGISDWLKKDDDPDYKNCSDQQLAIFLNGLIIEKRGKKDGPQPEPEKTLNNNIIFRKLKIALNLQADDVISMVNQADFRMSKHELSAFFRKPGHKHYRECKDQVLRYFLKGMQLKYRG